MEKLLFETLDEFVAYHIANELDESRLGDLSKNIKQQLQGKKKTLMLIIDDPEDSGHLLKSVFKHQINMWPEVEELIDNLTPSQTKKIARDAFISVMQNSSAKVSLPLIKKNGRLVIDID